MASSNMIAVLRKNLILLTRSRNSVLGIGGWLSLMLQVCFHCSAGHLRQWHARCPLTLTLPPPQICLPAAFFLLMWIPRYYIKPMSHGQVVVSASVDLESRMWAGAIPYSGPAVSPGTGGQAHILLAPAADGTNAARVSELAEVLGKGLACPRDKESWNCPSPLIPWSFHCMFLNRSAGQQCQVTSHVLPGHTPHGTTWNRFIPVWYN